MGKGRNEAKWERQTARKEKGSDELCTNRRVSIFGRVWRVPEKSEVFTKDNKTASVSSSAS